MLMRVFAVLLLAGATAAQPESSLQLLGRAQQAIDAEDRTKALALSTALLATNPPASIAAEAHAIECWAREDDPKLAARAAELGLRLGVAGSPRAQLLSCRGNVLEVEGNLDAAQRDYEGALAEALAANDRRTRSQALAQLGYLHYFRGNFRDALAELQQSYAISNAIGYDRVRRLALSNIAHVYADPKVAQYDKAIDYYQRLLREYETSGAAASVADTLFNIGSTYSRRGDHAAALTWYRRALNAEQKLGRAGEVAFVRRSIGITLQELDRPAEALPLFDESLAYFEHSGDTPRSMMVRASRAVAYRKLGRIDEAIRDLERTREHFAATRNTRFLEKTEEELALAYAAAGMWEQAFRARTAHAVAQRTLADEVREEATTRMRVQFDLEREEQENRALVQENEHRARLLDAAARIRKLQTIVLVLSGATIVALIVLVVRIFRDRRRMRVMAMTDELTRLPNRRHLLAAAEEQIRQAVHRNAVFSLLTFDIDHFKRINDTWGHAAGDLVLQRVAHVTRTACRPTDVVGRTGGEEFTVVLPRTTREEAVRVAERLRAAVEAIDCGDVDEALRVTISIGVAEWSESDGTIAKLLSRADEVLYRAKQLGRNRVEIAAL